LGTYNHKRSEKLKTEVQRVCEIDMIVETQNNSWCSRGRLWIGTNCRFVKFKVTRDFPKSHRLYYREVEKIL